MLKLTKSLILSAVVVALAPALLTQVRAEHDCDRYPVLFSDSNFKGKALELNRSVRNFEDSGFNDEASSVCVPSGWTVILYEDDNFRGDRLVIDHASQVADLKRERPNGKDWGDRISSVEITEQRRGSGSRECDFAPVLFYDDNFAGRFVKIERSESNLHRLGVGDEASSVCVPSGWSVTLYEDTNFRGNRLVLNGPVQVTDLKRRSPDRQDWGDRVSSIEVEQQRFDRGRQRRSDDRLGRNNDRSQADCRDYPVLFDDNDFRGRSLDLRDSRSDLHRDGFGDTASSACVPSGWRIILYQDTNYRGASLTLDGPVRISDLKRQSPYGGDWGDRVSSVRVESSRSNRPNDDRFGRNDDRFGRNDDRSRGPFDRDYGRSNFPVKCDRNPVLFHDKDFGGHALVLRDSIRDLSLENFDDEAASLCIPDGWTISLYEDQNFRGASIVLRGPVQIYDLEGNSPDRRDWAKHASSVRVDRRR